MPLANIRILYIRDDVYELRMTWSYVLYAQDDVYILQSIEECKMKLLDILVKYITKKDIQLILPTDAEL